MPLTELSPNVRRYGSHRSIPKGGDLHSPTPMAPRGVQSMLRTATETGDIGQFAVRPSRLPRSSSRLPLSRPRSSTFDSPFTGHRHPYGTPQHGRIRRQGPRQMRSFTNLPRPDTIRSTLTSYTQPSRHRMNGPRPYLHGAEGLANQSIGSRSLYSHRSLLTLRSQRDYRSMHSSSPGGLVVPMRRAGQRFPSPAFSDVPGYVPRFRSPYSRAASVASSPSVVYSGQRRNLQYNPDMNNSYTSFARLPSPAMPLSYAGTARSGTPSRTTTPGSFQDGRGASNASLASSLRGLPNSPTGSSGPVYYDYSESFVEEDCFSPVDDLPAALVPFGIDQTIHEHGPPPAHRSAQTPFGLRPGSVYNPVELPTSQTRITGGLAKATSPVISPAVVPKRTSSLFPAKIAASQLETVDRVSLAELPESEQLKSPSTESVHTFTKEQDPRRASIVSTASRLSSHSSTFFPNASRSPRNLADLAARVHSPDLSQTPLEISLQQDENHPETASTAYSTSICDVKGTILHTWQLPSFTFRPLSMIPAAQCSSDRPRTSTSVPVRACTAGLLSPTPERPMSSQSRKRFSKILDIEDDYPGSEPRRVKRSFNSLNFQNLKRVDEIPDSNYPARFSIPPFSPQNFLPVSEVVAVKESAVFSTPTVAWEQTSNPERSTVDSLLDRHIEALGLMSENDDEEFMFSNTNSNTDIQSSATYHTFNAMIAGVASRSLKRSHSLATAPSQLTSSLSSTERRQLMPRRLFASVDMATSRLSSFTSAPRYSTYAFSSLESDTPSYGWQKLSSSSQLNSMLSIPILAPYDIEIPQDAETIKRFKIRRRSALSMDPTSSRCSQSMGDICGVDGDIRSYRRPREAVDRQTSHRRRQRIRLKLKHNSQSLASIAAKEVAEPSDSKEDEGGAFTDEQPIEENGPAELDSTPIEPGRDELTSRKVPVPDGDGNLIDVVQQPVQKSIDIARMPSVRTVRSHPSMSSLMEPINSTRLAAQSPPLTSQVSIPMLAQPDLGPPIRASTFDLSIPFAPAPSTVRPTLRETQSFFSDDSSRFHHKPESSGGLNSMRTKLGLQSLSDVVPASSVVPRAFTVKHTGNRMHVHHSCNIIASGKESFDEDALLDGTVGMSDFAYRKRKMLQKVKDWWMRQCVQKKLVGTLRRKKSAA